MIARPPKNIPAPVPISLPTLLLVEGDTPQHFFEALLKQLGIADQIEIRKFGGVTDLKKYLIALAASDDFKKTVRSIGIVRDAEKQSIVDVENSIKYAVTAAAISANVTVRWFILPDNSSTGMLETLCMTAVRQNTQLSGVMNCVDAYFDCLRHQAVAVPQDILIAKHEAQVYLASRDDIQMYPGIAASRGHWPWDSPAFDLLKQFLQSL